MLTRLFIAIPILAVSICQPTIAQEQLRWKFQMGDTAKYSVVQNMETSTQFGDETVKQIFNQTIDMSWQIQGVAASGDTVLTQVFDRVRLKMEGGAAGTVEFDTASTTAPDNPIVKALSDVFSNIVGQPFQVSMRPTGQIDNVTVPPKLLAAVKQSTAGQQGALDEKMLQDMMKQSAVMLPTDAVGPGSKWSTEQNVQMPFGTMTITSEMSYAQKDASGNAVIDFVPTVKITPREGAQTKMNLDNSMGRGRVIFDVARGRVNSTQLDLTLQMTMEVNGQKLPQTIRNQTSMTLAP